MGLTPVGAQHGGLSLVALSKKPLPTCSRPAATQVSWNSVVGLGQSSPISLSSRRQREKSAPCVLQYDMCSRRASLSELARSPVRSSAAPRSGTAGKRGTSVRVAASIGQSTSMYSFGSRCRGGRDGRVAAVRPSLRAVFFEACRVYHKRCVEAWTLRRRTLFSAVASSKNVERWRM